MVHAEPLLVCRNTKMMGGLVRRNEKWKRKVDEKKTKGNNEKEVKT